MHRLISRRRAIAVLAAAAGVPLLLEPGSGKASTVRAVRWQGTALGAPASLSLYHEDAAAAERAIAAATAELARLEAIFSLYRADSAMVALNRDGHLDEAPRELVELLSASRRVSEATDGSFDPSIQPLWQVYFQHFTAASPDPNGPAKADIDAARALVDWRGIEVDGRRVRLGRPGMALSLNGIAQGYITDRVTEVLRGEGLERMLVDMGEPRAASTRPDGTAWRVGIAHPAAPETLVTTIEVIDKAVATSGGYGTMFDAAGRFTHLIDPRSGATAPSQCSVTVVAASAAKADALSTALSVVPAKDRASIAAAMGVSVLFVGPDGGVAKIA